LQRGEEVEYGFLGVVPADDPIRDRPRETGGVVLKNVIPNSPAARAGLRHGDIVLQVNGQPIRDYDDLFVSLGASLAGRRAELLIKRLGEPAPRTVDVVLAKLRVTDVGNRFDPAGGVALEKNANPDFGKATNRPAPIQGLRVDYTSVIARSGEAIPDGVVVREVLDGSAAKASGLVPYVDIITEVNDQRVNTPAEFLREANKSGHRVRLTLRNPPRRITLP
jgi:serine protease Do